MTFRDQGEKQLSEWMRAAQDGDRASYDKLLRQLLPALRVTVRHKRPFLQAADIEDLVQDILMSLHSVRATYDPERPFMPWLMAIARNRMADAATRYGRRLEDSADLDALPETFLMHGEKDHSESAIDREAFLHAVDSLPAGQRLAIDLLKIKGLSLREASRASGFSVAALKVAVHRAVNAVRKTIREKN